jgi:large subunit ribosomal protein L9
MKVILKSKIKKLGNIGDVIDVADGYGKNLLIPTNLALFYTEKNYESFKVKKVEIEKENQEKKGIAEELADKIKAKEIILIENAGDDGKLYGSISGLKLANYINSLLKINDLKKSNVFLKYPIKEVGKFEIEVELHPEVFFDKEIIIARSKEEAVKIKKGDFTIKKENPELVADLVIEEKVKKSDVKKSKKEKFSDEKNSETNEENKEEKVSE